MKHTLVAGPGRTGTSVLMQILYSTGADVGPWKNNTFEVWHPYRNPTPPENLPKIIKKAHFSWLLPNIVEQIEIEHIIIPIRSTKQCTLAHRKKFGNNYPAWGMPVGPNWAYKMEWVIGKLVTDATLLQIPFTTLHFPLFAEDPKYLYFKLKQTPIGDFIHWAKLKKAHNRHIDLKKIQVHGQ